VQQKSPHYGGLGVIQWFMLKDLLKKLFKDLDSIALLEQALILQVAYHNFVFENLPWYQQADVINWVSTQWTREGHSCRKDLYAHLFLRWVKELD
jgi:hypothetical protein